MAAKKLRPDPGVDENGNNFGIPRHVGNVVDEIDVMTGQAPGKKRLLVILGFDKNNFHRCALRNAFAPARRNDFNPQAA
jgi:hypothetical protein